MHIGPHGQVEGFLNVSYRPCHVHVHAIARRADHREAVRFRETNHGVIVFLTGTIFRGELFHRKVMAVRRTGRIVEFLQECFQRCLVAQRENEDKPHRLHWGKVPDGPRLPIQSHVTHMKR